MSVRPLSFQYTDNLDQLTNLVISYLRFYQCEAFNTTSLK
ncbi:hypothetical protein VIBNIAM115_670014 [Vibrio nigripulchritudo AM115]|nr:hypothetical protein VIBNIAM115_670014 [Vibrio nigripulchritudo AM115]